jgi:hypothetical protein
VELKPGSQEDLDGSRTAAVLEAYFRAEHTRAARRLAWARFGATAVVLAIIGRTTNILPSPTVLVALAAPGAAAGWMALVEWRASERLNRVSRSADSKTW